MVSCGICLENYDNEKKIPKFLSCFHTFCVTCLQNLESNSKIRCPSCRRETIVGPNSISELQNNFYITGIKQEDQATALEKEENGEPAEWCTQCKRSASADCGKENHVIIDLEKDSESCDLHLQLFLMSCKAQWNTAIGKHREVGASFELIHNALTNMLKDVKGLRHGNLLRIGELQRYSKVFNTIEKTDKMSGKELKSLLDQYQMMSEEANAECKKASDLLAAFEALNQSTASIEAKNGAGKDLLETSALKSFKMGFPKVQNNSEENRNGDFQVLVSFGVLSSVSGEHLEQMRELAVNANKAVAQEQQNRTAVPPPTEPVQRQFKPQGQPNQGAVPRKIKVKNQMAKAASITDLSAELNSPRNPPNPPNKPMPFNKSYQDPTGNVKGSVIRPVKSNLAKSKPKEFNNPQKAEFSQAIPKFDSKVMPPITPVAPAAVFTGPFIDLKHKKCMITLDVNGQKYGNVIIDLRPDVAPVMCQKFAQYCDQKNVPSYNGTIIYKAFPKEMIMGGRIGGIDEHFVADRSPLKKNRGAIFLRLKQDYTKTNCFIVSSEFCIQLSEDKAGQRKDSTVFGYVSDGIAICDAISHIDYNQDNVAIGHIVIF